MMPFRIRNEVGHEVVVLCCIGYNEFLAKYDNGQLICINTQNILMSKFVGFED